MKLNLKNYTANQCLSDIISDKVSNGPQLSQNCDSWGNCIYVVFLCRGLLSKNEQTQRSGILLFIVSLLHTCHMTYLRSLFLQTSTVTNHSPQLPNMQTKWLQDSMEDRCLTPNVLRRLIKSAFMPRIIWETRLIYTPCRFAEQKSLIIGHQVHRFWQIRWICSERSVSNVMIIHLQLL